MSALDDFRAQREFKKNPPTVMPGMESSGSGDNMTFPGASSPFGQPTSGASPSPFGPQGPMNTPSPMGSPFSNPSPSPMGSPFGSPSPSPMGSPFGSPSPSPMGSSFGSPSPFGNTAPNPAPQQGISPQGADMTEQYKKDAVPALLAVFRGITGAFRNTSKYSNAKTGFHILIAGAVEIVVGLLLFVANLFNGGFFNGHIAVTLGGVITSMVGLGIWYAFNSSGAIERAKYVEEQQNAMQQQAPQVPVQPAFTPPPETPSFLADSSSDEDEDDDWDFSLSDDEEDEEEEPEPVEVKEPEEVLESMPTLDKGMFTRQYLWEAYKQVLPQVNPDFGDMREVDEESSEFEEWGTRITEAATVAGLSIEDVSLETMYENLSIYQLKVTRQSGASSKEKNMVAEVLNSYKMDEMGRSIPERSGAFSTYKAGRGYLFITIFKASKYMVSVGDIYNQCSDWVLDTSVKVPWAYGVSQDGEIWKGDLLDLDSMIVAGMPRFGKSWNMFSIMLQMCMWMSPKDLNFECYDVKEGISEYSTFTLPHLKRFESDPKRVVERIKYIVNVEGARRKKILAQYGVKKIQDLPDEAHLPYLYIVIDEMVGLNNAINSWGGKDELNVYRDCLNNLISQLPATGIRPLMVPHRIVDNIIPKTASSLVACRMTLGADTDDALKGAIDETSAAFGYSLPNKGDAAAKIVTMNSGKPFYCHSAVIATNDEDNKKLTKFVQSLWNRIEPDEKGWWDTHKAVNAAASGTQPDAGGSTAEVAEEVEGAAAPEPKKLVSNWVPSDEETYRPKPGEGITLEKEGGSSSRENTRWVNNDSAESAGSVKEESKEEDNPYDFWDSLG